MSSHNKTSEAEQFGNLEHDGLKFGCLNRQCSFYLLLTSPMEASLNYFMEMRDINNLGNRHKKSSENLDDKSLAGCAIFVSPK